MYPPQPPPTRQPWFKTHVPYKHLCYRLESVNLSHLTRFFILSLRLTKQGSTAALEAQAEAESGAEVAHRGVLAHKIQGSHLPTTTVRVVRSFQGNA